MKLSPWDEETNNSIQRSKCVRVWHNCVGMFWVEVRGGGKEKRLNDCRNKRFKIHPERKRNTCFYHTDMLGNNVFINHVVSNAFLYFWKYKIIKRKLNVYIFKRKGKFRYTSKRSDQEARVRFVLRKNL